MENFNNLLTRRNAAKNVFPERFFFDAGNEFFGDLKIDISFEQSQPHLAQCSVDVRFADRAVSTQLFEYVLQFVAELRKHGLNVSLELDWGAQAASLFFSAACRKALARYYATNVMMSPAGCRRLQAGSLRSPDFHCATTF